MPFEGDPVRPTSPSVEFYAAFGEEMREANPRDESYPIEWQVGAPEPKSFTSVPSRSVLEEWLEESQKAKDFTKVFNGEVNVVDPVTGGQKGSKQAQLGAVSPRALMELAKVAGFGGEKYERYNFMKGYRWSLSYDAMQRHLHAFWGGQDLDEESGLPHLAHAAWHCLALIAFMRSELGTDDRPPA